MARQLLFETEKSLRNAIYIAFLARFICDAIAARRTLKSIST